MLNEMRADEARAAGDENVFHALDCESLQC
jgi:hypothetical protein